MSTSQILKALEIYSKTFQKFMPPSPFMWDPKNKKLFYIESPNIKLIPWYINQFIAMGIVIGSCNILILRQFFYRDGVIPLLNLMILISLDAAGGVMYLMGITYVLYGKEFHYVWNELARRGKLRFLCEY